MSLKKKVYEGMKKFLAGKEEGMRAKNLSDAIHEEIGGYHHSVSAQLSITVDDHPHEFEKIKISGEGTFYLLRDSAEFAEESSRESKVRYSEEEYYEPFAEFLAGDGMDECTKAIVLGGNKFGKEKWLTPDVIGVNRSVYDTVQFPDEIISVEIKSSTTDIMTGFGQACAYRLFSHKTYLVIPKLEGVKQSRVESLCIIFGVGLVYFDDQKKPDLSCFECKFPASKHFPDMVDTNSIIPEDILYDLYELKKRKKRR